MLIDLAGKSSCAMGRVDSTAEGFDKGILSLPQIQYLEEMVANLNNPNSAPFYQRGREDLQSNNVAFDFIIENQRGTTLFGISLFSHNSLMSPFDPPNFQTLHGVPIVDLQLYPLPDFHWKWSWDSWSILMVGDVDENGFVYSHLSFSSTKWRGIYKFGNFVRRRLWIRKRERVSSTELSEVFQVPRDVGSSSMANMSKVSRARSVVTMGQSLDNLSLAPSKIADSLAQKVRTREKLRDKVRRKKSVANSEFGEHIEFIVEDSSFVPSIYASENVSVNSYTSDEDNDVPLTLEQGVSRLCDEVDGSKIDREKIDQILKFVQLCTPDELSQVPDVLLQGPYLGRILHSFDHFSTKDVLVGKLEQLASENGAEVLSGIQELIRIISQC